MLAFERSERVSITTGTAKHKNVAGGDPMRSPTTLSGSPSATTGMVAIARGACHFTRYARFVARYHGLLNGHPLGVFLVLFCLHDVALDEGGGRDFFIIHGLKFGIFIYFCKMNDIINLLTH